MNTTSLVRQLKKLNRSKSDKGKRDSTNLISFLALILSLISIYLQFFYERFDLSASLIDAEIKKDTISLNIVYHNKGNQDATIISSDVYFFLVKNKDIEPYHIQFVRDNQEPYILSPGKQTFKNFIQKVYFDEKDLLNNKKVKNTDTLRVGLKIQYLRDNSLQAEKRVTCGWITLDSINKISSWYINYQKIELDSDSYFVSQYSKTE